jgi:hypothetical protein
MSFGYEGAAFFEDDDPLFDSYKGRKWFQDPPEHIKQQVCHI